MGLTPVPKRYVKKPIAIQAMQWNGENLVDIEKWLDREIGDSYNISFEDDKLYIHTEEGIMVAEPGSFIIIGVKKEIYPCRMDIFLETYDRVI